LRKGGKRDTLEWMEVAVDSTFDTSWSYRIMFSWLVASSGKIDAQVQLLQRRCTQYGLNLVPFPQITLSKNVFLYPFKAPAFLTIRDKDRAARLTNALIRVDFIHDGMFHTDVSTILECLKDSEEFDFQQRWGMSATGNQFIHRSGTLFVRVLTDRNGLKILVVMGNYRYILMTNNDEAVKNAHKKAFRDLTRCICYLESETTEAESTGVQEEENKISTADLDIILKTAGERGHETEAEPIHVEKEETKSTTPAEVTDHRRETTRDGERKEQENQDV